jgi:hypothetical protein
MWPILPRRNEWPMSALCDLEAGIAGSGRGVADRTCGEVVAGEPAARVAPRRAIAIAPSPGRKTGCLRSKA